VKSNCAFLQHSLSCEIDFVQVYSIKKLLECEASRQLHKRTIQFLFCGLFELFLADPAIVILISVL